MWAGIEVYFRNKSFANNRGEFNAGTSQKSDFWRSFVSIAFGIEMGESFFVSLQNVMNYFCELHTIIFLRKWCYDCIFVLQSLLALMYFLKN